MLKSKIKLIQKFIFAFSLCFSNTFFATNTFAQFDVGDLPAAPSASDNQNIFLHEDQRKNNNVDPNGNPYLKSPAQKANGNLAGVYEGTVLACPYSFERDLNIGSKGEDVRLLQKLLNSDKRTIIAVTGAGSLGKESDSFGDATKTALKKFQALFIEYIGVANGNFGPRTRTVMNAICNSQNSGDAQHQIGRAHV